jgi:asparagine synthase (glutamine-hydrolysing)
VTAIGGYWSLEGAPAAEACAGLLEAQSAWGPHRSDRHDDGALSIGRNLFRILPEDKYDSGIAIGGGGRLALAASIRLDDHEGLAGAVGADTRDLSDAALAMKAFEKWGEAAVERLYGDFALALWDRAHRRLLLARDALGNRPLHYCRARGFFAFASMPAPLAGLVGGGVSSLAIADFLALLPETGRASFFEGVETVRAGEILTVDADRIDSRLYWSPDLDPVHRARPEDYAEALREGLDRAVAARMRGAGDAVASHLSGGLDSSAVTATAARSFPHLEVFAYTSAPREGYDLAAFGGAFADETGHAGDVAALYPNIRHIVLRTGSRSPIAHLERDFLFYQRPLLNVSNVVWGEAIHDEAKARRLAVLLTGGMGNLTLTYDGMQALPEWLAGGRWLRLAGAARGLHRSGSRWGTLGARTLSPFLPSAVLDRIRRMRGSLAGVSEATLLREDAIARFGVEEKVAADRPAWRGGEARLARLRSGDWGLYNAGTLAGWGLDVRDPTADRAFVEQCLRIPSEAWLCGNRPRGLARLALSDRLPAAVVDEPRKGLQAADWHEGFDAALPEIRREVERIAGSPKAAELLDIERMRAMLDEWPDSGRESRPVYHRYCQTMLRGIAAGHFIRMAGD